MTLDSSLSRLEIYRGIIQSQVDTATAELEKVKTKKNLYLQALAVCSACMNDQLGFIKYQENFINAFLHAFFDNRTSIQFRNVYAKNEEIEQIIGTEVVYFVDGEECSVENEGTGCRALSTWAMRIGLLLLLSKTHKLNKVIYFDDQLLVLDPVRKAKLLEIVIMLAEKTGMQFITMSNTCNYSPQNFYLKLEKGSTTIKMHDATTNLEVE